MKATCTLAIYNGKATDNKPDFSAFTAWHQVCSTSTVNSCSCMIVHFGVYDVTIGGTNKAASGVKLLPMTVSA